MEVIRVLQLGVRLGRFSTDEGLELIAAFLALLIVYVANDLLFRDAFQLASTFKMAFYDALYVALARTLEIRLITADRRLFNLANQRGLNAVAWFEDLTPSN
jgi:predicted nucleic acid-binding protein